MRVVRVEDAEGFGPYGTALAHSRLAPVEIIHKAHSAPGPAKDVPGWMELKYFKDWFFGCTSIPALVQFFGGDVLKYLSRQSGYTFWIVEFEVPDEFVLVGTSQVAFYRFEAETIGTPLALEDLCDSL